MATLFVKLEKFLGEKKTDTKLYRGNVRSSLEHLLMNPRTTTGSSSYAHRHAKKDVWTDAVSKILTQLGIAHKCGNDAPRGGASGEYVEVTSKAFLRDARKKKEEFNAWRHEKLEEERKAEEARKAQKEAARKTFIESMVNRFGEDWKNVVEAKSEALLKTDDAKRFIAEYVSSHPDATFMGEYWNRTECKYESRVMLKGFNRNQLAIEMARHFNTGYSHTVISVALGHYKF